MLKTSQHLVRSPSDVRVLVPVELHQRIVYPVFQPFRTAIADNVQNPLSDPLIGVGNHFEDPLPENLDVALHIAGAELLDCLQPDLVVLGVSVFEDQVDVVCVTADGHEFFAVGCLDLVSQLLLVIFALLHFLLF